MGAGCAVGVAHLRQLAGRFRHESQYGLWRYSRQLTLTLKLTEHSNWLWDDFYPFMKKYHKGPLVYHRHNISKSADVGDADDSTTLTYIIYDNGVYDLTDYFYTLNYNVSPCLSCLKGSVSDLIAVRRQMGVP